MTLADLTTATHVALLSPLGSVAVMPLQVYMAMPGEALTDSAVRLVTRTEAIALRAGARRGRRVG